MKCCNCNTVHTKARGYAGGAPENGDVAICHKCGAWLVFEEYGMREPSKDEVTAIESAMAPMAMLVEWMQMRRAG